MKLRGRLNRGEVDTMLEKKYRKTLERLVNDYFERAKIEKSRDIYRLANRMGFDVRKIRFNSNQDCIQGMLLVDEEQTTVDDFSTNKAIGINIDNSIENNRFIVAHELCHYIFQKMTQKNFSDKIYMVETRFAHDDNNPRDLYEQIIDYMAAAILMPYEEFGSLYKELKQMGLSSDEITAELCLKYGVPDLAIQQRINEVTD